VDYVRVPPVEASDLLLVFVSAVKGARSWSRVYVWILGSACQFLWFLSCADSTAYFRGSYPALIPLPCTAPVWNFWSSSLRVPRRRCSSSDLVLPPACLLFSLAVPGFGFRFWFVLPLVSFAAARSVVRAVARFSCAWILPVSSSDFLTSLIPAQATQCSALAAGSQLVKPQVTMQLLGLQLTCLAPGALLRFLNSLRHRRPWFNFSAKFHPSVISSWALPAYLAFLPPLLRAIVLPVLVLLLSPSVPISAAAWLALHFGISCWDSVLDCIRTNGLRCSSSGASFFYSVFSARPVRAPAYSFFLISLVSLLTGSRPGALSCFFLTLLAAEFYFWLIDAANATWFWLLMSVVSLQVIDAGRCFEPPGQRLEFLMFLFHSHVSFLNTLIRYLLKCP
jgi:hypothetical protein